MKKYFNLKLFALSIFCSLQYFSSAQTSLMIDSCYVIAQRNYPLIRQYELIEKANEYTISNANKAYLPQLSVSGIGAYIFGGMPSFGPASGESNNNTKFIGFGQLNQLIWDGGASKSMKEISRQQSSVEKAGVDVQMHELKERISQLYFGILLIDEQIKQIDIQITALERNSERVKLLSRNGLALITEADELQAEVLKVKQRKTEFQFSRKSYLNMLSLFLATQLEDSVKFVRPQETIVDSKNSRPELSVFESQRKLIDAQYSINSVKLMPKVGLLGAGFLITPGINLGSKEKSTLALAGLNLSWELGGLYTNSNNKNLRQVNLDKIQSQQETFLFNTSVQSKQSTVEIEKYRAILQSDEEIVKLRKKITESYQLQYNNGSCSLFDLITATEKETEARSNHSLHDVQLLLAATQLKNINGN
jgi:outer membrane protein TolC